MNGGTTLPTPAMVIPPRLSLGPALQAESEPDHVHAQNERSGSVKSGQTAHDVDNRTEHGADPKMRPLHMSIELPNDPIEVLYDHKLSIEDHSPKPCIVPGNALHLIDDDPSPRSQTPSSVIIIANDAAPSPPPQEHTTNDADRSSSEPPPTTRPAPRVRFRSRVRITSGVHRHRHAGSVGPPHVRGQHTPSGTSSSGSASPSSSISAPLRYHPDENAAWGPLGRRLSAYASAGGQHKRLQRAAVGMPPGARQPDDRTPLMRAARRPSYAGPDESSRLREEEEYESAAQDEAVLFGSGPRRLLNPNWWWWHLEPLVCCTYCSEDSDYEE